jgi:hypothetical protein
MFILPRQVLGLRIAEIWFADRILDDDGHSDIVTYVQLCPHVGTGIAFHTSIVDLSADIGLLWGRIKKGFAYEIRRAIDKDAIDIKVIERPTCGDIDIFVRRYKPFSVEKKIGPANRAKLSMLAESGRLVFTYAIKNDQNTWLAAHAYICDAPRVRLLYSSPNVDSALNRQEIGRANKALHWKMIQYFKSAKFMEYDFGGLSLSLALKNIDDFKHAFGGRDVAERNFLRGTTLKGRLALLAHRIIKGRWLPDARVEIP